MSDYKSQIIDIIRKYIKDKSIEILLFGSRAEGNSSMISDYDLAIRSKDELSETILSTIKEELDNSNIPFKVDLVDYNKVSDALRESIDRSNIKW